MPVQRLRARTTYRLETRYRNGAWDPAYVAAPMRGPNARYGGPAGGAEWTTTDSADETAPAIVEQPTLTPDAAHPHSHILRVAVTDASAVSLLVRARGPERFVHRTYHHEVFGVRDGCVFVPHYPGSGTRLHVTAEDASGNRTHAAPALLGGHPEANELIVCLTRR